MIWMTREGENGWAILVLVDEDFDLKTLLPLLLSHLLSILNN